MVGGSGAVEVVGINGAVAAGGGDSNVSSATGGAGGSILGLNSSEGALGAKQKEGGPTRPATGLKGGHGYYNGEAGTNTGGGGSSYIAGYAGVWTKGASEGSGMTKSSASYTLEIQKDDGTLFSKSAIFQKFMDFIFSEFRNRHTILNSLSLRLRFRGDKLKHIMLLKLYHI